jgi:hypothetical protein
VSTKLLCLPGRVIKDLLCTGSVLKKDVEKKKERPNRAPSTCLGLATPLKLPQSYDRFITSYRPKTPVAAVPAADGAKED